MLFVDVAGLLAWLTIEHLPADELSFINSGMKIQQVNSEL